MAAGGIRAERRSHSDGPELVVTSGPVVTTLKWRPLLPTPSKIENTHSNRNLRGAPDYRREIVNNRIRLGHERRGPTNRSQSNDRYGAGAKINIAAPTTITTQ